MFFLIFLVNVYLLSQREEKAKVLAYGNEVDLIPWHPPIPSEGPLGLPEHKRVLLCVQLLPRPPNPFWPDERQERTLCPHPPVFWSNASRPSFHLFVSHRQMAAHWYRTVSSIPLQRQKYNINLAVCLQPWQQLSSTIKILFYFLLWQQPETHLARGDRLLVSFFFYHQLFSWGMDRVLAIQGKVNINHPLHLYSPVKLSDAVTSISSFDLIFKSTLGVGGRGASQDSSGYVYGWKPEI